MDNNVKQELERLQQRSDEDRLELVLMYDWLSVVHGSVCQDSDFFNVWIVLAYVTTLAVALALAPIIPSSHMLVILLLLAFSAVVYVAALGALYRRSHWFHTAFFNAMSLPASRIERQARVDQVKRNYLLAKAASESGDRIAEGLAIVSGIGSSLNPCYLDPAVA